MQAYRWIDDSRDEFTPERLAKMVVMVFQQNISLYDFYFIFDDKSIVFVPPSRNSYNWKILHSHTQICT